MKKVFGLLILTIMSLGVAQSNTEETIQNHCAQEWPRDYSMRAYCEETQLESAYELANLLVNSDVPEEVKKSLYADCYWEWEGDYSMQTYCLEQQFEGYRDVMRGPSHHSVNANTQDLATIQRECQFDWPSDFSMRSYCEEEQIEALAYLSIQPSYVDGNSWNSAKIRCSTDWPSDFSMQKYCVNEELGL